MKNISKSIVMLFIVMVISFLSGCFSSEESSSEEIVELKRVILTSDKTEITADNTDTVKFTIRGYDQNNVEITSDIKLYKDGVELIGTSFKTGTSGSYKFKAKTGTVTSNEITVKANEVKKLTSISIISNPSKTSYNVGDTFSTSGLSIKATYSDGSTKTVTGWTTSNPSMSSTGTKTVTVTYTEGVVTKTTTFNITVNQVNTSYSMAQKMLGQWVMSYKLDSMIVKEYYTFNKIESSTDGTYGVSGYLTQIYTSTYGYTSIYEIAYVSYMTSSKKMGLLCYWGSTYKTGSFYSFTFTGESSIYGDYSFVKYGDIQGVVYFSGTKTSSSYAISREDSYGEANNESIEKNNLQKLKIEDEFKKIKTDNKDFQEKTEDYNLIKNKIEELIIKIEN